MRMAVTALHAAVEVEDAAADEHRLEHAEILARDQRIAEGLAETRDMLRFARAEGMRAQVTISAAFGCPFEGEVKHDTVLAIAEAIAAEAPEEIALADTIGVGTPWEAGELFGKLGDLLGGRIPMRAHFHNTRGTGIANVWAAVEAGASVVDAALGGLGGCPFAPGAAGNVATEDLVLMLNSMGLRTGIDLDALLQVRSIIEQALPGEPLYGFTPDAGPMLDYRKRITR